MDDTNKILSGTEFRVSLEGVSIMDDTNKILSGTEFTSDSCPPPLL